MKIRILAILSLVLIPISLYFAFIYAPTESTMGHLQRIFYFHVPHAILSYMSALLLGFGSLMYLIKGDLKWDRLAYSQVTRMQKKQQIMGYSVHTER